MEKSAFDIYKENCNKIVAINEQSNQLYEEYKRVDAEYDARFRELDRQIDELRKHNSEIAKANFTFSLGEVLEEITKVATRYGVAAPNVRVHFGLNHRIVYFCKNPEKIVTVEDCKKRIENNPDNHLVIDVQVNSQCEDRKKGNFKFTYSQALNFDLLMCDGSKLQDNLHVKVFYSGFVNEGKSHNLTLRLNDGAEYNFPIVINLMEYENKNIERDCGVLNEAFSNLLERRNAEMQASVPNERKEV